MKKYLNFIIFYNKMARKFVCCLIFGDKIPSKSIKLKKIQIFVILFGKQFDDKIFETLFEIKN